MFLSWPKQKNKKKKKKKTDHTDLVRNRHEVKFSNQFFFLPSTNPGNKTFLCLTQLSMIFFLLINVKHLWAGKNSRLI